MVIFSEERHHEAANLQIERLRIHVFRFLGPGHFLKRHSEKSGDSLQRSENIMGLTGDLSASGHVDLERIGDLSIKTGDPYSQTARKTSGFFYITWFMTCK